MCPASRGPRGPIVTRASQTDPADGDGHRPRAASSGSSPADSPVLRHLRLRRRRPAPGCVSGCRPRLQQVGGLPVARAGLRSRLVRGLPPPPGTPPPPPPHPPPPGGVSASRRRPAGEPPGFPGLGSGPRLQVLAPSPVSFELPSAKMTVVRPPHHSPHRLPSLRICKAIARRLRQHAGGVSRAAPLPCAGVPPFRSGAGRR
jgi:hypothetical protein